MIVALRLQYYPISSSKGGEPPTNYAIIDGQSLADHILIPLILGLIYCSYSLYKNSRSKAELFLDRIPYDPLILRFVIPVQLTAVNVCTAF